MKTQKIRLMTLKYPNEDTSSVIMEYMDTDVGSTQELEKLYALGMKPLLLIAHPPKMVTGTHTYQTKIMLPVHAQLSTSAKTCLENVNAIYKLMVEAIGGCRVLDEIGRFHRVMVILDSCQEGRDELDFTADGLRNQRARS
ncbi:hypothetical protein ROHU_026681 [Labeo rohita]|uniref:Uncharacterized protein n=1 Tax=Labeo rohita TaxID=84645 RepID=A0A498MES6_LABRO|nr:hypothetical protein ROHU_026681 [Labeo rohita]